MARLEAVSYEITRHEAVAGVGRSLGERVGHSGRANNEPLAATRLDRLHEKLRDPTDTIVAPVCVRVGASDGDDRVPRGSLGRIESGCSHLDARPLPAALGILCHLQLQ